MVRQVTPQRVAQPDVGDRFVDGLPAGRLVLQRLVEQFAQVEDLDTPATEGVGEAVVLLLGPVDPGQTVEEQGVVVARGEPPQFVAGAVQHHGAQPADLGTYADGWI